MIMAISQHDADEQAIRALLRRATDAWDRGDGQAYGAEFEEDADYVTFGGMHSRGRAAIASEHQQLFDTFLRGSRLQVDVDSLRFLSPDVAVAHIVGGILDEPGQTELRPERRSIQTAVVLRRDGVWRIAASQVTRIQSVQPGVNVPERRA
jgi:uncharacterized protein (TIGR02246 family)